MDKLCVSRADDLLHNFEDVLTYRGQDYVRLIGTAYVLWVGCVRDRCFLLTVSCVMHPSCSGNKTPFVLRAILPFQGLETPCFNR